MLESISTFGWFGAGDPLLAIATWGWFDSGLLGAGLFIERDSMFGELWQ